MAGAVEVLDLFTVSCEVAVVRVFRCQPRVRSSPAEDLPQVLNLLKLEAERSGSWLAPNCSSYNPVRQQVCSVWVCYSTKRNTRTLGIMCYLCVYFLWDGVLLNPRMDLSQLLSLLLGEPGLEGLKHTELLSVFCQNLTLVPELTENCSLLVGTYFKFKY